MNAKASCRCATPGFDSPTDRRRIGAHLREMVNGPLPIAPVENDSPVSRHANTARRHALFLAAWFLASYVPQVLLKCCLFELSENSRLISVETGQKRRSRTNPGFKRCC